MGLQVKSVEPCANTTESRTELIMHVLHQSCQYGLKAEVWEL